MKKLKLGVNRIEMDRQQVQEKWSGQQGIDLAYPKRSSEIVSTEKDIMRIVRGHTIGASICEVGCGPGRLAKLFDKQKYIGIDINETAVAEAVLRHPGYKFSAVKWDDPYPPFDIYLFFTVLIHIPDDELVSVLKRVKGRLIIGECMFRWIRNFANGMNFQRDPYEYKVLIERLGGRVTDLYHMPYTDFPYFFNVMVAEIGGEKSG